MKAEHTPGPWKVNHGNEMHHVTNTDGVVIAEVYHNTPKPQPYSNARLIAAAPELLEALKEMIPYSEGQIWTPSAMKVWNEKAKRIIHKATQP
jgi:hypothetical protein